MEDGVEVARCLHKGFHVTITSGLDCEYMLVSPEHAQQLVDQLASLGVKAAEPEGRDEEATSTPVKDLTH